MAIDAHSTTAPADHRALLRTHGAPSRVLGKSATVADLEPSFIGAVPVPTPALTAETVAMLDAIPADVPHRGAPICSAADLPSGVASDVRHRGAGDAARARHMRRALEDALDHGTALLAALGVPPSVALCDTLLVEPGFVPLDGPAIGDAVDTAIATLDALDAPAEDLEDDGEAEPSLGWIDGKPVLSDSHDDREAEDDAEPTLGAPERHPQSGPWGPQRDSSGSQTDWADGSTRHDEAEAVNEDGGDILDEGEETLGWAANVSQLALGPNTADGDITALERHGKGFLRSGPDDAEDDDPSGGQQRDEDALFWSVDVGCAMGATVDVEGAHV